MANVILDTINSAARLLALPSSIALSTANSAAQLIPGGEIVLGATIAGTSGAFQLGTWTASEFAKFGKNLAGTPGELSAALVGASTGGMGGFLLGSLLGATSGGNMVNYFLGGLVGASVESRQRQPLSSGDS
jgi:hypothetical protein